MTDTIEEGVRRLLRNSEELRQFLEAEVVPSYTDSEELGSEFQEGPPGSYLTEGAHEERGRERKRVLIVVTHVDPYGDEQGWQVFLPHDESWR